MHRISRFYWGWSGGWGRKQEIHLTFRYLYLYCMYVINFNLMLKILHCFFYSFLVVTDFWVLLQSVFFCEQSHATVCSTHSPPPSYPLIPLTSLTPFRKTLLITSQHTGKTYSFNLSWNVTMPADDTNVNKHPISWRSVVQSSNSVLRKIFSWGKQKNVTGCSMRGSTGCREKSP